MAKLAYFELFSPQYKLEFEWSHGSYILSNRNAQTYSLFYIACSDQSFREVLITQMVNYRNSSTFSLASHTLKIQIVPRIELFMGNASLRQTIFNLPSHHQSQRSLYMRLSNFISEKYEMELGTSAVKHQAFAEQLQIFPFYSYS